MDTTRGTSSMPEDREPRPHTPARRIFYRSAGVVVTDQWFVTPDRKFVVAQMQDVRTGRSAYDAIAVGTAVASIAILVAVGASLFRLDPAAWPGMIVIGLVPVVVAGVTWRLRPRRYELWALYQGAVVQIFQCADEKTFGHVCRALIRARERGAEDVGDHPRYAQRALTAEVG